MSTVQDNQNVWSSLSKDSLNSKYEKCLNITEEIYKRINITFQIKKLETGTQSDVSAHSDQIDSNELSNETDLFACDKTDSLPSSTEAELPATKDQIKPATEKFPGVAIKTLNNNNNNEDNLKPAYKKPRKRFRKRVKKRPPVKVRSDSEGSSSETTPLSRVAAPRSMITTRDIKQKPESPEKKTNKKQTEKAETKTEKVETILNEDQTPPVQAIKKQEAIDNIEGGKEMDQKSTVVESVKCSVCDLPFRSFRGLRRHIAMSHITDPNAEPAQEVKENP